MRYLTGFIYLTQIENKSSVVVFVILNFALKTQCFPWD